MSTLEIPAGNSYGRGPVYLTLLIAGFLSCALAVAGILPPTALAGLILGLIFLALFLRNLKVFVICYIAGRAFMELFLDVTRLSVGGASMHLLGAIGIAILIGGFFYILINNVRIYEISVIGPMLLFLVISLPMLFFSPDPMTGFKDWVGTASAVMLFVLITSLFTSRKDIKRLVGAILLSSIVPMIIGFYQLFTNSGNHGRYDPATDSSLNSILATFSHPNAYAVYLAMLLILCVPIMIETKNRWHRFGYMALSVPMLISILFTYGRSAWMELIVGMLIISAIRYRKLLLLWPALAILVALLVPSIITRIQEASVYEKGTGSMVFRMEMWKYLLPYFYNSPLAGNGLGSFATYGESGMGVLMLPHNDYIRLLVDTGVVGLLIYLTAMFGLLREMIRSYRSHVDRYLQTLSLVGIALVITYLLGSITDNLFRGDTTMTYFWTIAGLGTAGARIAAREKNAQQLQLFDEEGLGRAEVDKDR